MTEDDSGLRAFLAEAIPMLEEFAVECEARLLVAEIEAFLTAEAEGGEVDE